jgi:hypothetical protein
MNADDLERSWDAAALAAVAVVGEDGVPAPEPVVPLVNGAVGFALTFDRAPLARLLATTGSATLATWDSRLALRGWAPLAADVRVAVVADLEGRWIDDGWLDPLLRAHPPSRTRLDTPLQRREHWWYVPRWLVRVSSVERVWPLARRAGPSSGLLAWRHDDGAAGSTVVEVGDWDTDPLRLTPLGGGTLDMRVRASVLARDVRTPDLDHDVALTVRGRLDGDRLHVDSRAGRAELGRAPSLRQRLAAARSLERDCRRGLAAHGQH